MEEVKISLAAARVNAGMTQEDTAREMHVNKATIVAWEKGKTEPRPSQLKQLSELYNMPLRHIFLPCDLTLS